MRSGLKEWIGGLSLFCSALASPASPAVIGNDAQQFADMGRCELASGSVIENCRIGYRTFGKLNSARSNIIAFPTWYNGRSEDIAPLVRPGGLLDPDKYFVVAIDSLGDGVSSSPSNAAPAQRGTAFPHFTLADMVDIEHRLIETEFGAKHIKAVVGISMGGMQAYQWAVRYPSYMDVVVAINGTPWLTSADRLTWSIMRQSIQNDPDYRGGTYDQEPPLRLANEVDVMFSYTGAFRARATSIGDFDAWLKQADAQRSIGANNRLWQIDAIAHQDLRDAGGADAQAKRPLPSMLVVTSSNDQTVNPLPSLEWARRAGSRLLVLNGDCGHMAPVCEIEKLIPAVNVALAGNQ